MNLKSKISKILLFFLQTQHDITNILQPFWAGKAFAKKHPETIL